MKVGDVVRFTANDDPRYGIVTFVDDSHRQTWVTALFSDGSLGKVWVAHLEVINEDR